MKEILIVGCSIAQGYGLTYESQDPELWSNLLINDVWGSAKITNLSEPGRNNHWIFTEAANAIHSKKYHAVIVSWSYLSRLNVDVGLELYSTRTMLNDGAIDINVNPNNTYSKEWLIKTGDRLRAIQNDHWAILDLVKYVNILLSLKQNNLFFVNTLFPWSQDYFRHKEFLLPSDMSKYQQDILQAKTRDDSEVVSLYNMIHQHYQQYGGICEPCWLNLYTPLRSMQVDDVAIDDTHPGYRSQQIFVNHLSPVLKEKLK